ncbi:Hypothetical protein NTJ_14856 [Nesidiocoris tenuis]|uniref:Uncharacterized protein n=1 Tax=Nesidiocoris tenuis TaxID=355587 RepID=A0ABN7BCR0_9HEMI|nr:Hypothetical protein NTJ_14856 [Nesidiocoris tenuis]
MRKLTFWFTPEKMDREPSIEDGIETESCIVVDDQCKKQEPPSILPRTRLIKKGHPEAAARSSPAPQRFHDNQSSWYNSWDEIKG